MGSPITLSGFNNIDFGSIVTALMTQASLPLTALQNSQVALQTKVSTFSTLATQIAGLQSAAASLADPVTTSAFAGSSSDPTALGVTTSSSARAGHYDVIVNEVARAQVTVSTSSVTDPAATVVATGGTVTIGGVAVTLSGDTTLQGLADAINGTTGIGVTAAVLHTGDNQYRLALTSTDTGAAHAFTVTNGLTGGAGVTFAGNAVTATDASLLVNNVTVTSSSNTITDVVPGLTLTALKKDPAATISVDVVPDSAGLKTRVQAFITAYNSLAQFTADQRTAAGTGDTGSIGRDPMLSQLRSALRTALLGTHGTGTISKLAEIGVEFTQTGTLQLNDTVFDTAITDHAADVQAVFAGTSGVFPAIQTMLDEYSPSTGYISTATDQLNAQIQRMTTQILNMQDRLATQRIALQQEFAAADAAIKALNNQSGALSNFSASLGSSL